GVIVACNDNFVKIIGSSREKLIGLNMLNLPDKNMVFAVEQALNGGQGSYEGIYSSVTAKKNTPVRCLFAPMNVGGGGITRGVGIIEDITERKRLELELSRANENNFLNIFDSAADGILIADIKSKKFYRGNPAICRMLGYSLEEIKNIGVMDIHPEKDIPYIIDQFEKLANGEMTVSRDLPVKRKDGAVIYADINSTTITLSGKTYILGFFHDITERRQADVQREAAVKALRESEMKYRHLYEKSRDAIMILEPPSWKFTAGNPAAIEMFKAKNEEEFVSCEPWKLSPERQPDGRASEEKAREMIEKATRDGFNLFEWTHKRINGEEFLATVLLSRVEKGDNVFLQATVRDVTKRRQEKNAVKESEERFR